MAMTGTIMTPRVESKIRSRLLAHKLRNKAPDFKNILRERFKTRIIRNRKALFEQMRSSTETSEFFQGTLCNYLYDEIHKIGEFSQSRCYPTSNSLSSADEENSFDIERELELMKQIEDELIEEQLNWILEEYRKAEQVQIFEQTPKLVCCPVCQGGFLQLTKETSLITCAQCPIHLYTGLSLEQIETTVSQALNEHATYCNSNPQFAVVNEPSSSGLFVICGRCSLFNALC